MISMDLCDGDLVVFIDDGEVGEGSGENSREEVVWRKMGQYGTMDRN